MPDKVWKAMERRVAKKLGGKRVPCSGIGQIKGDVFHSFFEVECKYRRKFALKKWFDDLRSRAKESGKIPILVVKMKGQHSEFVVLDLKYFVSIFEESKRCRRDEQGERKEIKGVNLYECTDRRKIQRFCSPNRA
ncbi:MAG: hypothetical protein AB1779_07225 [Candidatus Thermoplasmatota archaeon]